MSFAAVLVPLLLLAADAARSEPTPAPTARPFEATSVHSFEDVERWKKVFDDPSRDEWQRPGEVVAALRVRAGMRVADLGAGTGYFLGHLARAAGETGTVFAADTGPNLVAHLRARAEQEGLGNVVPVLASANDPRLPRSAVDLILIVDTYHHIDDRLRYFRGLERALAPGGRVAVIDWQERPLPVGPPPEHKLTRRQVVEEMTAAGYTLAEEPSFLPYQYFLVFEPGRE